MNNFAVPTIPVLETYTMEIKDVCVRMFRATLFREYLECSSIGRTNYDISILWKSTQLLKRIN